MSLSSCLPQTDDMPLVSMIVFGYNQADIIAPTITAAFAQTYPRLEIILSDNGSSDGTFDVMQGMAEAYDGPHLVRLNRNDPGLGFIGHVNQAFALCKGALIVYNPGDDISVPERTAKLAAKAARTEALLIHSDAREMDLQGRPTDTVNSQKDHLDGMPLEQAARELALCIGATCAWRPELMHRFGPIIEEPTYDDLIFGFRAMLCGGMAHVPEPLVHYRTGEGMSQMGNVKSLPPEAKAERAALLLRRLELRAATLRQRRRDCLTIGRTELAALLDAELDGADYTIRLLKDPGFDRWSRFGSLSALQTSFRARARLRRKLTVRA